MKRVLVVPWSIAPTYCAIRTSPSSSDRRLVDDVVGDGRDDAADERPGDRDPGVLPVRVALPRDGQHEVRDAWAQVACRVDRVARRPAERHADPDDEQRHDEAVE